MQEWHTGAYQHNHVELIFDVIAPNWNLQLIGVATDGASTTTECIKGACTCLSNKCNSHIFQV
jgi:hypothetical protein